MIIEKSFFDRLKQIYLVEEFCGYTDEDIDYDLVEEALTKAGRTDLIGFDKHCLIRPRREHSFDRNGAKNDRGNNSHRSSSKNDRDNFHSKNSVKNDRRTVTSGSRKKITASGNNQQNTGAKKKKTIRNIHKKK